MTAGRVRRVVVADKVETIRRMLGGIATIPLSSLAALVSWVDANPDRADR